MSLTGADVAEIMRLVEGSSFDEVILEVDGLKLSLKRGGGTAGRSDGSAVSADATTANATAANARAANTIDAGAAGANAAGATAGNAGTDRTGTHAKGEAAQSARGTQSAPEPPTGLAATRTAAAPPGGNVDARAPTSGDPNIQDVTSPLLGTCYRAPRPGAPPFVEVGSAVEEDTVVAIVEVMKLMNTVRAGVKGTVSEILMRDGVLVEYGETLLRIRKAG